MTHSVYASIPEHSSRNMPCTTSGIWTRDARGHAPGTGLQSKLTRITNDWSNLGSTSSSWLPLCTIATASPVSTAVAVAGPGTSRTTTFVPASTAGGAGGGTLTLPDGEHQANPLRTCIMSAEALVPLGLVAAVLKSYAITWSGWSLERGQHNGNDTRGC